MFKLVLEKAGRGSRDQIANILWIIEKAREFQKKKKKSISALLTMPKPLTLWITINCGKFWKRWEYLTCLLRNLYAGQETTVRNGHGTADWFQIGKGMHQGCILSQSTLWDMLDWKKHKLESRLPGEISITQICRWHHPYGRNWRGTKKPLDERKRGEWKSWLKAQHSENEDHGIRSHHFVGNRWGNHGNTVRLYFLGSKITADGAAAMKLKDICSLEWELWLT